MRANSHCFKRKRVLVQTSKTKMGEIEIEKSQLSRSGDIFNGFGAFLRSVKGLVMGSVMGSIN